MVAEVWRDGENEPQLLPMTSEKLHYRKSHANEDARFGIVARGFWSFDERPFFIIRVFDAAAAIGKFSGSFLASLIIRHVCFRGWMVREPVISELAGSRCMGSNPTYDCTWARYSRRC